MRLIKAEFRGFGRIASGKINLDNKVIAIVGPNEAGKTTLLKALAYIDNGAQLSAQERSRGLNVGDDTTVVRVQYLLDPDEQKRVAEFDLEEVPQSIWLWRMATDGEDAHVLVEPAPRKALAPLRLAVDQLRQEAAEADWTELAYERPVSNDEEEIQSDTRREGLMATAQRLVSELLEEYAQSEPDEATRVHEADLRDLLDALDSYGLMATLREALAKILEWHDRADPTDAVANRLWQLSPSIILFEEKDRNLGSTHYLSDEFVASSPIALLNLLKMGDLDLSELWATYTSGDEGERDTLINGANQVLARKFAEAWKQSKITVVLKTEQTMLAVRIMQDGKRITQFDERSAGLKMFIALIAFLAARDEVSPPVLLIDEAETHLHIDAQADLVNTFMRQDQAAKIIYSTHSPACLPPDLGSNIRAVIPDPDHEYRSLLKGSFWEGAAGFSPLMLAMGAGAAAFSTARYVVLSEGASEMLVLPSLTKRAINVEDLDYQVAPGLSETPPEMYPELDLAGARVAYLVDGDAGGLRRRSELIDGGVPEDRIVTLRALTLENLLDETEYLSVLKVLFAECNPGRAIPSLPGLPPVDQETWPNFIKSWAKPHKLKVPGKRIVASRLVEDRRAVPSEYGVAVLRTMHSELSAVLARATSSADSGES